MMSRLGLEAMVSRLGRFGPRSSSVVSHGPTVNFLATFRGPRAIWFYKVLVGCKCMLAANKAC